MSLPSAKLLPSTSVKLLPLTLSGKKTNSFNLNSALFDFVDRGILSQFPPTDSKCQEVSRNTFKVLASMVAIAGKIPFVAISLKLGKSLGSRNGLGGVFAYGNTASFTALIVWAMLHIIDDSVGPKSEEEKRLLRSKTGKCCRSAILASSFLLGVTSQLPVAYLAYDYNDKKIYMPILIMASDSWVSIYSANLSFSHLVQKNYGLTPFEKQLIAIKTKIVSQVRAAQMSLTDLKTREVYLEFLYDPSMTTIEESSLAFLELIINPQVEPSQEGCSKMKIAEKCVGSMGLVCTASQMFIYGLIGYKGAVAFWKNPYFGAGGATIVVGANAYLSGMSMSKTAIRFFKIAFDLVSCRYKKSLSAQLRPNYSLALTLIGLLTASISLGPSVQVPRDYLEEGAFRIFVQVTLSCATILLVSTAILDIVDDLIAFEVHRSGNEKEKDLIDLSLSMKKFAHLIDKSSLKEFSRFLNRLPNQVLEKLVHDKVEETKEDLKRYLNYADSPMRF